MTPIGQPPPAGLRIVVADDDAAILHALRMLLEEAGYTVVGTATDGPETLALVEELTPDLLLVDLRMPGLTGLQVAAQLRERMPGLQVIVLSAYDDAGLQLAAERIPVAGYLVKGCSSRLIFQAIDDALARPGWADQP